MLRKKILYIATEVAPFLRVSSMASIVSNLAQSMAEEGHEVRIIMPKFGVINERTNRIHEVQRLYGININIEEENISLIVKVAPIKRGKIQVYFIDNEDLFQEQKIFRNEKGKFYEENDTRIAFICKGVWAILQHLGWGPDIVHCLGWPWAFVPLYGKIVYHDFALFNQTKFVYTYGPQYFAEELGVRMLAKASMRKIKEEHFMPLKDKVNFASLLALAKMYSDAVTYSFSETHTLALEVIQKIGARCIPNNGQLAAQYAKLYDELHEITDVV